MVQAASESAIASTFLKEIGAPDTDIMRKAVTAWLRKESGRNVIGNNPWNISLAAAQGLGVEPVGSRAHGRTGQKFAVYGNLTDGTRAAARLLLRGNTPKDKRGYAGVIAGARSGDPIAFLQGLASSKWSADRYGGPSNNSLLRVYKSVGGLGNVTASGLSTARASGPRTGGLGAFGDLISFPVGHIITEADVGRMMGTLEQGNFFTLGQGKTETRAVLMQAIGKPWTKDLQNELSGGFASAADTAGDPFGVAGLANVFDPGFWARILALGAGVLLVGFGVIRLAKA